MAKKKETSIGKYVGKCGGCELVLADSDIACPRCSTEVIAENLTDIPEIKDEPTSDSEVGTDTPTA